MGLFGEKKVVGSVYTYPNIRSYFDSKRGKMEAIPGLRYRPASILPGLKEVPKITPVHAWLSRGHDAGAFPLIFFISLFALATMSDHAAHFVFDHDGGLALWLFDAWVDSIAFVLGFFLTISYYPVFYSIVALNSVFDTFVVDIPSLWVQYSSYYESVVSGQYRLKDQIPPSDMIYTAYVFIEIYIVLIAVILRGNLRLLLRDFTNEKKYTETDARFFINYGEPYFKHSGGAVKRFINKYILFY